MKPDAMLLAKCLAFRKTRLLALPTPLHPLNRLSKTLGVDLWIKRDDLTGMALGGNKGRKLEYLMADAVRKGADCIVTCGAIQSNHVRQTAAAAAMAGLPCRQVLLGQEDPPSGNLLLSRWLGAQTRFVGTDEWPRREETMWDLLDSELAIETERLEAEGWRPYTIPLGGSSPHGVIGFINAVHELEKQMGLLGREPFDSLVFATSSGGTQTGLQMGINLHQHPTRVIGICADPEDLRSDCADLARRTAALVEEPLEISADDFEQTQSYVGPGYALPSDEANEAIGLLARTEGILLDPVYSGKAFAGLLGMVRSGELAPGSSVLFWHTGGVPALFAAEYSTLRG